MLDYHLTVCSSEMRCLAEGVGKPRSATESKSVAERQRSAGAGRICTGKGAPKLVLLPPPSSSPHVAPSAATSFSPTISSYPNVQTSIFCANRGFMLRPPIAIARHKLSFPPNSLTSTVGLQPYLSSSLSHVVDPNSVNPSTWLPVLSIFVVMSTTSSTVTGESRTA